MKKIFFKVLFLLLTLSMVSAQNITTASAFFQSVSEKYGTISDYEADMDIVVSGTTSETKVSFKRPNLLRIDYSKPAEKVIVFNGDTLTIYVPEIPATMTQTLPSSSDSAGMNLATPQGLALMSRYYTIGYEVGQNAVPLDDSSDELVIKLVLYPKSAVEGFRTIKLAISPDTKLIRRVEAVSNQGQVFVFLFSNYVLNQGITDQRFVYDAPSSTNTFNNFLFSE